MRSLLLLLLVAHTLSRLQGFPAGCEHGTDQEREAGGISCCCLKRACRPLTREDMSTLHANSSTSFLSPGPCSICGASPMHRCAVCGTSVISSGAVSQDTEARWLAFFCLGCSRSLEGGNMSIVTMRKNLKGRWCLRCKRMAIFGPPRTPLKNASHCIKHKSSTDVDLLHPRCEYPHGCNTRPCYAPVQDSKPRFCAKHKLPGHVDKVHAQCEVQGCSALAIYGSKERGRRAIYCAIHKSSDQVNKFYRRSQAKERKSVLLKGRDKCQSDKLVVDHECQ